MPPTTLGMERPRLNISISSTKEEENIKFNFLHCGSLDCFIQFVAYAKLLDIKAANRCKGLNNLSRNVGAAAGHSGHLISRDDLLLGNGEEKLILHHDANAHQDEIGLQIVIKC